MELDLILVFFMVSGNSLFMEYENPLIYSRNMVEGEGFEPSIP